MLKMPRCVDKTKSEFCRLDDFINYMEQNFKIKKANVSKFLMLLAYNDFTNFYIFYNEKEFQNKLFSLIIFDSDDDDGNERMSFSFYKAKNNKVKVTFSSLYEELSLDEIRDITVNLRTLSGILCN